jgi:hypothetical protein
MTIKSLIVRNEFWAAVMASLVFFNVVYGIWQQWRIKKKTVLNGKVDVKACKAFQQSIGQESDEHKERLVVGEKRFMKIEKCLIFLVEKAGGDAATMGLYD